ncbi:hypothetical protein CPB83DRAFT_851829 [Crepidotus variabilis]|uniref:Uncharacterized protein n=1 Tax=Crepidotus variabilis TaxID=179855 RepID=A0A9P6JRV8_9AGAR|nr:hypothetical protein CPB83DRAFT_851829 [Crepidotus variabilis]
MAIPFSGGTSRPGFGGGGIFNEPDADLLAPEEEGVALGGAAGGGGILGPKAGLREATGGQGSCCWPETSRMLSSRLRLLRRLAGCAVDSSCSSSPSDSSSTLIGSGCVKAGMGRFRTRISFRIRILMPWSAREHDSGVDSSIPGNFFAVYT